MPRTKVRGITADRLREPFERREILGRLKAVERGENTSVERWLLAENERLQVELGAVLQERSE